VRQLSAHPVYATPGANCCTDRHATFIGQRAPPEEQMSLTAAFMSVQIDAE
jgi:hypothetical protein